MGDKTGIIRLLITIIICVALGLLIAYYQYLGWAFERTILITIFVGFLIVYIAMLIGGCTSGINKDLDAVWALKACGAFSVCAAWLLIYNSHRKNYNRDWNTKHSSIISKNFKDVEDWDTDEKAYSDNSSNWILCLIAGILALVVAFLAFLHVLFALNCACNCPKGGGKSGGKKSGGKKSRGGKGGSSQAKHSNSGTKESPAGRGN